jgi:cell division inhibitor SepF
MGTLEKLKAYFGMVPAHEDYGHLDGYDRYPDYDEESPHREPRGYRTPERREPEYDYDEPPPRPARARAARRVADLDDLDIPVRGRVRGQEHAVSGALAMERAPEPVARLRVAEQPAVGRDPLSRIVTLHPAGYAEARGIGEAFRDGNPVIMNLTEMDNADAKRLVDFAAGLAFALRGSMDKVTSKVFLLSPADNDVSAEDRQRIAEDGLFLRR